MKKLKFYSSMLCLLFTLLTVFSSGLQLFQGQETDTNFHILMRFVICIIAVTFWAVFSTIELKSTILTAVLQYTISMGLIFGLVFTTGFFIELADTAYRDIFLNYTIPFWVIAAIIVIYNKRKNGNSAK